MATVKTLLPKKQTEESRIRIAAYCRVSTDSADQKDSFDAQVEYYTRYIGENPNGLSPIFTLIKESLAQAWQREMNSTE